MSTSLSHPSVHPADWRFPPDARVLCLGHAMKETLSVQMALKALELGVQLAGGEVAAGLCVSDGGDGFLDAFAQTRPTRRERTLCHDPIGRLQLADFLYDDRREEAVIEMARCCGMALIQPDRRDIINSGTTALGDLILRAMTLGAKRIHVGLGGSATCDGGLGMLLKLESVLLDKELPAEHIAARHHEQGLMPDIVALRRHLQDIEFVIYSDVQNPLLGPRGTARFFAPQKGATLQQVELLEHWMTRWADKVAAAVGSDYRDVPGSGAAGGVGFAFAALGATLHQGTDLFFQLIDLPRRLEDCDGLVTCEGRFDKSSLEGKAPWRAAVLAREAKKSALIVCGSADPEAIAAAEEKGICIVEAAPDLPRERRLAEAFTHLQQAVERFLEF